MAGPLGEAVDRLSRGGHGRGEKPDHDRNARDAILVLVTDGQVGNEDQILQIARHRGWPASGSSRWGSTGR